MKKLWKIKNLITTTLAIMSTIIAVIFLFFIASWQVNSLEQNLYDSMNQLSDTIVYNITSEFNKMNQASLSILYSNTIRENFQTCIDIHTQEKSATTGADLYESSTILNDMVNTILTGEGTFSKIVLYNPKLGSYTFGHKSFYSEESMTDKAWYPQVINASKEVITSPYEDIKFSSEITYNTDRKYISLIRPYYSDYNTIQGYVEIAQAYDIIFDVLDSLQYDTSYHVVILDGQSTPIYPLDSGNQSFDHYIQQLLQLENSLLTTEYQTTFNDEIVHLKSFDHFGYQCLIIVNKAELYRPITNFITKFILLSIIIISVVILVSRSISKSITEPIYSLYNMIKYADIVGDSDLSDKNLTSNILEMNALWLALVTSHNKLRDSMNQLITAEKRELQSKMIALQSQMNPHFLFNSLSVLNSIIENNQTKDALFFSENLSSMLRYISATDQPLVILEDELEHTHSYLECMGYRYENDLIYIFNIPDSMLDIKVPKLCVQILVENAIKYATLKQGPWHIMITSYIEDNCWFVSVTDNGYGFTELAITEIINDLSLIKQNHVIPHLSLDGMGLMNLLYRIKLHCQSNPYLNIINLPEGGCTVTIGGKILHE